MNKPILQSNIDDTNRNGSGRR
ncbi:hypothetical protein D049_3501A, partial [Vibrio parahaemolyticus VPTS-2010]